MSRNEFQGTSDNGDFHEALRDAIGAALEGLSSTLVHWRLRDVRGAYGGFVNENRLTVTISASVPGGREGGDGEGALAGETRETPGEAGVEVPIFLVGIVEEAGPSICNDGVRFLLRSRNHLYRLKPTNEEAERYLESVAGSRQRVSVAGYRRWGPECPYIDVYHVGPADRLLEQLGARR